MSDIGISPEDRERLAKTKFGEWFDEFFEKKFTESFDRKIEDLRHPQGQQQSESQQSNTSPALQGQQQQQRPQRQRRRSLLEECFSQTFGWS
jgi:hypothetical protein